MDYGCNVEWKHTGWILTMKVSIIKGAIPQLSKTLQKVLYVMRFISTNPTNSTPNGNKSSMHDKFTVDRILRLVIKEHAGESGVQLSVGAAMEAYGDQVATTSVASLGSNQGGIPAIPNHNSKVI